jgi:hypothetical protein
MGVAPEEQARVACLHNCQEGTFPFRYLGIPMSDKKLTLALLFLSLCCCLCSCAVHRVLSDVLVVLANVAMVSSPLVGRGYYSASMVGNQSTGRVSLPGQRCQPINRSSSLMGLGIVVVGYQTKLKEHVSPYVVLVINDNPYGLTFALSYIYRTYP